mgnify:CR=1 FL=1
MKGEVRNVKQRIQPLPVIEGAGVRLKRSFPTRALDYPDPFLLFDHFGSENPADYVAGFPMHPHRGIETVTYMKAGQVRHGDSLGNKGVIQAGDVQWMTAGRGILHEEMPAPLDGKMEGFQLWVNLPAKLKMTSPRYQEVSAKDIPEYTLETGVRIQVIAGEVDDVVGPVREIAIDPTYLDVHVPAGVPFVLSTPPSHTVIAYVYEGSGYFDPGAADRNQPIFSPALLVYDLGEMLKIQAGDAALSFLVMMGAPLHEPIARYGPFVMNTQEQIQQTLRDLRNNTFIR